MIRLLFLIVGALLILTLTGCQGHPMGFLDPKGIIASEERKLFFDTLALMLIVVLPVIIMSFVFVYHYQVSHRIKDYKPHWSHSYFLESLWWGIPCLIILILAIITWKKTHELDPYQSIQGNPSPSMQIEVIALPWKWLFIYPKQGIATINYLAVPVGQPVEYSLTADNVPMSAFFVPQLGSQIYAMAGMRSRLNLLANEAGVYNGMNTQFNGDGFSDMYFSVHVVTEKEMHQWIKKIKTSASPLTAAAYNHLADPSIADKPAFFSDVPHHLFENIINMNMNTFGKVHPHSDEQGNFKYVPK